MDSISKQTRSRVMAAVRSKGNRSTEKRLRYALVRAKIKGWKLQATFLLGNPDFVFSNEKVVVFVDGCFWHGCPRCYRRPHTSQSYWDEKVKRNVSRDKQVTNKLRRDGWSVIRIWEHELSNSEKTVSRIRRKLATKCK